MLSPKVVRPLSHRDKVLLQCDQTEPMHFDDLLSDRFVFLTFSNCFTLIAYCGKLDGKACTLQKC